MTRAESLALATAARKAKTITAAESRARLAFVERLLVDDVAPREIVRRCRERFGMSAAAVERVKTRILDAWRVQDAELRELRRGQQRRRLVKLIRATSKAKAWRAAVAGEALLAKIDGTILTDETAERARQEGERERDLIWQVLRGMTEEELRGAANEERERRRSREIVQDSAEGGAPAPN